MYYICSDDVIEKPRCGKGGAAILYKEELAFSVKHIEVINQYRITSIEIIRNNSLRIYIFAVNVHAFRKIIPIVSLHSLYLRVNQSGMVVLSGDMNSFYLSCRLKFITV
jgi:hypothetical protein